MCCAPADYEGVAKLLRWYIENAGTVAEQNVKSLDYLETTTGGMMYGVAKHAAHIIIENYCKNVGQPFVWMQFSNIYGIRTSLQRYCSGVFNTFWAL